VEDELNREFSEAFFVQFRVATERKKKKKKKKLLFNAAREIPRNHFYSRGRAQKLLFQLSPLLLLFMEQMQSILIHTKEEKFRVCFCLSLIVHKHCWRSRSNDYTRQQQQHNNTYL
jgi:hypothetical protein